MMSVVKKGHDLYFRCIRCNELILLGDEEEVDLPGIFAKILLNAMDEHYKEKHPPEPEIDTDFMPEIVCPHCGYEHSDSWEYGDNYGHEQEAECEKCGKPFKFTVNVEITYSSEKLS